MRREYWQFLGRKNYYGYEYWVWQLTANPRNVRRLGMRYWVKLP